MWTGKAMARILIIEDDENIGPVKFLLIWEDGRQFINHFLNIYYYSKQKGASW